MLPGRWARAGVLRTPSSLRQRRDGLARDDSSEGVKIPNCSSIANTERYLVGRTSGIMRRSQIEQDLNLQGRRSHCH